MSKTIAVSDEVYRRLKRELGDRTFDELLAERLDEGGRLADVSGQRILDREAVEEAKDAIDSDSSV